MTKNNFTAIGTSIKFMLKHPIMFIFPLIRFAAAALVLFFSSAGKFIIDAHLDIKTIFSLILQPKLSLFGLPNGLYLFFILSLLLSIASIDYTLAYLNNQTLSLLQSFRTAMRQFLAVLGWALFFSSLYFVLLSVAMPLPIIALPWIVFPTFFVPALLIKHQTSVGNTLIKSIQLMQHNLSKAIFFLGIFVLAAFAIGLALLQYQQSNGILAILWFLLVVLLTIKDIFKAIVLRASSTE